MTVVADAAAADAVRRAPLLAFLGALTIAFSAILVHQADVQPATAAVYRCAYAVPVLALLALAGAAPLRPARAGPAALRAARRACSSPST